MAAFLEACSKSTSTVDAASTFHIASPSNPIKWPIRSDNKPIASGKTPEQGANVKIYTYTDYVATDAIKSFAKKYKQYGLTASITTFEDTTEALGKIRSGAVQVDIFNPSYDQLGKLVTGNLIAPLNHSYIPNITNVWPQFQNPFYDEEWRYTIPYTVYTTGIAWRSDKVSLDIPNMSNPYDALWDTTYARTTSVLDDYHTCMGMVALRNGFDMNTAKDSDLATIHSQLSQMNHTMAPKVNVTDYQDLPTGVVKMCQAWSGDAVNMISYLPQGVNESILRYWFPSDGKGEVDNDLMVLTKMSQNPIATHLFLDHLLEYETAMQNFTGIGYQPPQNRVTPQTLVSSGFIPANLAGAVVLPKWFDTGARLLELPPAVEAKWQAIWQQFKAGA